MRSRTYDAVVVGTGATGGFAAKELAERGLQVLALEAGPELDESLFDYPPRRGPVTTMERLRAAMAGQPIQARAAWFKPELRFLLVNDWQNPYTCPPDDFYLWIRARNVGGRFHSWGRVAVRMSDYDFRAASRDGIGEDWPICYDDIVPYYETVEEFLKIIGTADGIPSLPDSKYARPAGLTRIERRFKEHVESTWPERKVVPWRYVSKEATPADARGEKRITSPLAAAFATGRFELRPNALVKQVNIDPSTGKASGVVYIDSRTKQEHEVSANVVVLCASTIESVRLLLNSACARHPNGVGNSSGVLGRYFMDQTFSIAFGSVPGSRGFELVDTDSPADNHGGIYMPRWINLDGDDGLGFARGFNVQGMMGRVPIPTDLPAMYGIGAGGEMLPYIDNSVTLDPRKRDAWGIPAAHIRISMRDNERKLLRYGMDAVLEMIRAMGWHIEFAVSALGLENTGKFMPGASWFERFVFRATYRKNTGLGAGIHECGGARMGSDPAKSVLNAWNQCWEVPNLFVTDSSCFVSSGTCGPTLTTMALTVRACEYIAREYRGSPDIPAAV